MMEQFFDFAARKPEEMPLKESVFVAFDFETTGLYPAVHSIVEVGAVKFTLREELGRFQSLVNPGVEIPQEAIKIHGIEDFMVQNQPCLGEILPRFLDFLTDSVLIGHNIGFDISFLDKALSGASLPLPDNFGIDTRTLAKRVFQGFPGFSLDRLTRQLNLPTGNSHRALDDAIACKNLFCYTLPLIPRWETLTLGELIKFSNTKLR